MNKISLALRLFIITLSLLLFWQGLVWWWNFPPYILPTPLEVFDTWWQYKLLIGQQAIPTLIETCLGLLLGVSFGMMTALLMIWLKLLRFWLLPLVIISQAIPTFALAPILVIWFGYGIAAKIATTIIMIFFPVTTAFYDGLKQTPLGFLDLAQTMNASAWQTLCKIRIPAALPHLASGIRVATAIAPIGAIIGEWVGASKGLGFLMLNANARMQIALMFAALLSIVVFALVLYFAVDFSLRKLIDWG